MICYNFDTIIVARPSQLHLVYDLPSLHSLVYPRLTNLLYHIKRDLPVLSQRLCQLLSFLSAPMTCQRIFLVYC